MSSIRIPDQNKKPGVCYAPTADGIELPVIDITHPAFACEMSADQLSALIDQTVRDAETVRNTPPEALKTLVGQSILARGWVQSVGSYMTGMITYLNRLGPENLGDGYASAIDRRMAAGLMAHSFRFRLRDVARLIADALVPAPATSDSRPIRLLNIGGGPAADSMNALILVNREHPERLIKRSISIEVLDVDEDGPGFGRRALAALQSGNGPLNGLDVAFRHTRYDWSDAARLREILGSGDSVFVCSSEGGLFDYGFDKDIVTNLSALLECTPADAVVVGSVVRDAESLDPRLKATTAPQGRPLIRYLGLEVFRLLAGRAGWMIDRAIDSVAHHAVALRKAD